MPAWTERKTYFSLKNMFSFLQKTQGEPLVNSANPSVLTAKYLALEAQEESWVPPQHNTSSKDVTAQI